MPADTNTPGMPMSQFAPGGTRSYITRQPGGSAAYLQSVDPNSLVQNQLASLQRSDNPIVQQAAQAAQANALARGGGVSGTQAIDASNRAMFDILNPIAGADAGQYAAVNAANQEALNQQNLTNMNNRTQLSIAQGNQAVERGRNHELAREFDVQQSNRAQDRQWALADQNTQARAQMRSQVFSTALQTIFSDPTYWGDPQGAMGLINDYSTNIDQFMRTAFPEYWGNDPSLQGSP